MSLINRENHSDVYFDLNIEFMDALAQAPRIGEQVATTYRVDAPLQKYKWLGEVPKMQRWIDDREIQKLRAEGQIIETEDWANGIEVERDDIDDDKLGLVLPRVRQLADSGFFAMEEEVVGYYVDGFTTTRGTTYDGKALFANDHTHGQAGQGSAQDNLITPAFDAAGTAFEAAYVQMLGFKDAKDRPLNVLGGRKPILLHGPSIWANVRNVLQLPTLSGGGQNPNFQAATPVMSQLITDGKWFLIADVSPKPVILQIRRDPMFRAPVTSLDDYQAFMRKTYFFGADATFGVGYGPWQTVVGSNATT